MTTGLWETKPFVTMLLFSIAETEISIHQSAQTANMARTIRVHSHLIFFIFLSINFYPFLFSSTSFCFLFLSFRFLRYSCTMHFILIRLSFSFDICLNVLDDFFSILFDIPSDAFFGIHVDTLFGIPYNALGIKSPL